MPALESPPAAAPAAPPVRRPRRRPLLGVLVSLVSLAIALLAGEVALRLVRPQEAMTITPGLYAPDPPRRYRLQPGYRGTIDNQVEFRTAVRIDSLGMRGPEPRQRAPGEIGVLALGDSFTFGVGAAESASWPSRLAALLARHSVRAQVWNAGAPGYGIPDEVAWYERWGAPLRPDVIVLAPFLANDLQDAAPGNGVRVQDGELVVAGDRGGLRRWLYYHSHLFRLVKSSLLEGRLRALLGLPEPWARHEQRAELALYGPTLPPALAAGARASEAAVERLAREAAAGHARVVAVLIPSLPQVDARRWRALHRELGVDPRGQDARRPNRLFDELLRRHGVTVLDATDALQAAIARGERVYWQHDQHLTPRGYEIVAEVVARGM